MKYLNWLKENINLVSVLVGLGFIVVGKGEIGQTIINHGASI